MIRFDCPHCAYRFEVDDHLAGHNGWCANCKNVISVPAADGTPSFEDLPDDEKLAALRRVLRTAVRRLEKAEARVRRLDRRLKEAAAQAADRTSETPRELEATRKRLDEAEAEIQRLNAELASDQPGRDFDNAAFEALEAETARLEQALDDERAARQDAEEALNSANKQLRDNEAWQSRHTVLQAEYQEIAGELEAARERLETERIRHGESTAALNEARQTIEQLRRKLNGVQGELASEKQRSQEQQDAAARLESQLEEQAGRIQSLEAENQRLAALSEGADHHLHEVWRKKEQEIAELREALETAREERDNALHLLDGLDGKLERLQEALEAADSARRTRDANAEDGSSGNTSASADKNAGEGETETGALFPEVVDQRQDPAPRELLESLLRFMQSG